MNSQQTITSLAESPQDDRRRRTIQYSVAMSIRLLCVILCFFAQGWWLLVTGLAAVLLPYIAVVLANNVAPKAGTTVIRPGVRELDVPSAPGMVYQIDIEDDKR
jgi:hypothetical protein